MNPSANNPQDPPPDTPPSLSQGETDSTDGLDRCEVYTNVLRTAREEHTDLYQHEVVWRAHFEIWKRFG
jgi:hypothetical protein